MIGPWYVMAYVKHERLAWRHGYALALHGSIVVTLTYCDPVDRRRG